RPHALHAEPELHGAECEQPVEFFHLVRFHFIIQLNEVIDEWQRGDAEMKSSRAGFTLFELILAVALFAVLLTLIGMAVNLYLMRVDADRSRVEEAQLARSVLTMIADDIHATSIYKPQDTKDLAQLMLASTPFNVDSIDASRSTSSKTSGPGGAKSPGVAGKLAAL